MKSQVIFGIILLIFAILKDVGAGIIAPLYIGNITPITNVFGKNLENGCLIEVKYSETTNCFIGQNAAFTNSGLFCIVLPMRIKTGESVSAVAYDNKNKDDSNFLIRSKMAIVPKEHESSLILEFGSPEPTKPYDFDMDGLCDSWENVLGTWGIATNDYDGDGMTDANEAMAGTDPTDELSNFEIISINEEDGIIAVKWKSVYGKFYIAECSSDDLRTFEACSCEILATNELTCVRIPNYEKNRKIRIRLLR